MKLSLYYKMIQKVGTFLALIYSKKVKGGKKVITAIIVQQENVS